MKTEFGKILPLMAKCDQMNAEHTSNIHRCFVRQNRKFLQPIEAQADARVKRDYPSICPIALGLVFLKSLNTGPADYKLYQGDIMIMMVSLLAAAIRDVAAEYGLECLCDEINLSLVTEDYAGGVKCKYIPHPADAPKFKAIIMGNTAGGACAAGSGVLKTYRYFYDRIKAACSSTANAENYLKALFDVLDDGLVHISIAP